MLKNEKKFYLSITKLIVSTFIFSLIAILGVFILQSGYYYQEIIPMIAGLVVTILFSLFAVNNLIEVIRGKPYLIITDDYLILDPMTKSEVIIYFTDIRQLKVSRVSGQHIIEVMLYNEDEYYNNLSRYNKMRLYLNRYNMSLFVIQPKAIPKQERLELLKTIDYVIEEKLNPGYQRIESQEQKNLNEQDNTEAAFFEKHALIPAVDYKIDRAYFKDTYKEAFKWLILFFVIVYLFGNQNNFYLLYIIVSFIFYPLAKAPWDYLFGFRIRNFYKQQRSFTLHMRRSRYSLAPFLFHTSIFLAPLGLLFLLARFIFQKVKTEK